MYTYDRGGNILNKKRYAFTTDTLETLLETIPYTYGDSNWKDKLTAYNGVGITYDEIGNPLFDSERTYTWGAGRQLRHISMPASGSSGSLSITNGFDADSQTILQIVRASDTVLEAHVLRGNREITDERPASAFNWTRSSGDATADATWNNAHRSMKQITLTTAEINGNMQFSCSYTETQGNYGTVQVNNSLVASHTPATADANDVFTIENGMLKVTTSTTNGTDYALNAGTPSVNNGFSGTLTSIATFNNDVQIREIDFIYDHNGMRTAKIVSENGRVEMTEYTLHGKLITHMTKRTVDENGEESTEELHFFYDAQNKPAFVEYEGAMYRYVHNLQGDIVAIVDTAGNLVVEYKYDAWGKPISTTASLKTSLGQLNPFRYRGYVYDAETELYYLRSRYYSLYCRFINGDYKFQDGLLNANIFLYCMNNPVANADSDGSEGYYVILNVYKPDKEWNDGNGHYDLSIISRDDPDRGWVYSYGPGKKIGDNEYQGRVNVYDTPSRTDHTPIRRYYLYDNLSEEDYKAFCEEFEKFATLDESTKDKPVRKYIVNKGDLATYNINNNAYRGTGMLALVSRMKDFFTHKNKYYSDILGILFEISRSPLIVTDASIEVFDAQLTQYKK